MTNQDPVGTRKPRPNDAFEDATVLTALTEGEQRFERWRRSLGLFLGPLAFLLVWFIPLSGLTVEAHRLAAVVVLVVVWWVTEAIPIPATSLVGAALTVVCGVTSAQDAFAPFASPTIFLFIGSFMIGRAVSEHQLDRRLALSLLSLPSVHGSLPRIAIAMGALTVALSAWMSNTATAAMMLPVAIGVLTASGVADRGGRAAASPFLLTIAYSASIGGIMTPVGTPPNLITLGLLDKLTGVRIQFLEWMLLAVPIGLVLAVILFFISGRRITATGQRVSGAPVMGAGPSTTGKWTAGQRNCAVAFACAVTFWVVPGLVALIGSPESPLSKLLSSRAEEAVVAVMAAGLLFLLPTNWSERRFTLDWSSAAHIDWGTILLFGGGLSLGRLMFVTGLAEHVGTGLVAASGVDSLWGVTALAVAISIFLTEFTSNTAATNVLVPVVISICQAGHLNPIAPAVGTALGASVAFMLPVSTPPNAIIYGSGYVPITAMIRYGVSLDIISFFVIVGGLRVLCPLLGYV